MRIAPGDSKIELDNVKLRSINITLSLNNDDSGSNKTPITSRHCISYPVFQKQNMTKIASFFYVFINAPIYQSETPGAKIIIILVL